MLVAWTSSDISSETLSVSVAWSLAATGSVTPAGRRHRGGVGDGAGRGRRDGAAQRERRRARRGRASPASRCCPSRSPGRWSPPEAVHVQARARDLARAAVSVTVAAPDALGPFWRTTIVYWIGAPGVATSWPSVLVTLKSACGVRVSVSVALLLRGARIGHAARGRDGRRVRERSRGRGSDGARGGEGRAAGRGQAHGRREGARTARRAGRARGGRAGPGHARERRERVGERRGAGGARARRSRPRSCR